MSDENIQDDHPEIVPKSAPKPTREPIMIEGEAADLTPREERAAEEFPTESPALEAAETELREPAPEAQTTQTLSEIDRDAEFSEDADAVARAEAAQPISASPREPEFAAEAEASPAGDPPYTPPPAPPPASGFGGVMRALGLVVLVLIAALGGAYLAPMLNGDRNASDERFAAIEAGLKDGDASRKALEARIAKLESSSVSPQALASVAADAKAAKAAADKASIPAPAPTVAAVAPIAPKPEPSPVATPTPDPEVARLATGASALSDRIAKLETALSAQKSEARADPLAKLKSLDPVAEAVAAISLAQRLAEGEPYAAEFAALSKSGADASALAVLQPYADAGAPTPHKLAIAFAKIAPTFSMPAKTQGQGEIVDDMMDKLRGLVKVHPVGEVAGDDPAALASQISAALTRGDVAAALAIEGKLPEPGRTAAAGWAKDAAGVQNATMAARALTETALKRFADAKS